ncbi:pyruvate kinase [Heliorestis convoluta]|uniref:Pyruvate kinase n=2 Tax=Heliorestis convoluta TaxID=356322 RepID=A0A5Q2N4X3_9FIRM|nr:pyruvate kinase [Heliorestis convoluta]
MKMVSEHQDNQENQLAEELGSLYNLIATQVLSMRDKFPISHREGEQSRDNLLAYLALRRHDIFNLQLELAELGLSSLGRLEESVLNSMEKVLHHINATVPDYLLYKTDSNTGRILSEKRARKLFGRTRKDRNTRIMVTLDSRYLNQPTLLEQLLLEGMDIARINCAHDHPELWYQIIESLRAAEKKLAEKALLPGRKCRIMMDLGGPKIRTGPFVEEILPIRLKVARDDWGRPIKVLEGYLDNQAEYTELINTNPSEDPTFVIAIKEPYPLNRFQLGEELFFEDTRQRKRKLRVIERINHQRVKVSLERTSYIQEGMKLQYEKDKYLTVKAPKPQPVTLQVQAGEHIRLYLDPAQRSHSATEQSPLAISCTLPEALKNLLPQHRVYIDDGKIGTTVLSKKEGYVELEVTHPEERPVHIRPEKGLNFPDTTINLPALTDKDRQDLSFIVKHADAVALSFIHSPQDLLDLQKELVALGREDLGIIAKIETKEAIHQLSRILLKGLDLPNFGIMIARGDLAVEVGFDNLSLVQEEILCLCEAAHIPVIWATQVLENLAKKGLPARAEITDAAMAHRAECVMLNKGPHILEAVKTLSHLLCSEERCHLKKRQIFREFTEQHNIFD